MFYSIFLAFSDFSAFFLYFTPHGSFHTSRLCSHLTVPVFTPHDSPFTFCMLLSRFTLVSWCFTCTHCMISLLTHYYCTSSLLSLFDFELFSVAYIYLLILCLNALYNFSEFILHLFLIYFDFIWISHLFPASSWFLVFFRIFCNYYCFGPSLHFICTSFAHHLHFKARHLIFALLNEDIRIQLKIIATYNTLWRFLHTVDRHVKTI